jgi:hypothetical protein
MSHEAVIVAGARTAIGTSYKGSLVSHAETVSRHRISVPRTN